jgi:DNA invertase Pin-like site-specific DNA recombinase
MAKAQAKRVALYLRVSTSDQTTEKSAPRAAARGKAARLARGARLRRQCISGAKDRKEWPGLDALLKAVARREIDMVAAWSVDQLGRSLKNRALMRRPRCGRCIRQAT